MTKTFNKDSIIPVEDYFVMVDKESEIKIGDETNKGKIVRFEKGFLSEPDEYYIEGKIFPDFYIKRELFKVIATISKRIGDIPLIELPDGVDGLAKDFADRLKMLAPIQENEWLNARDHFKFGYEANKGKYSEEDMRKAYNLGAANQTLTMAKFPIKQQFLDLLKSLQTKRPIKIVLEYESYPTSYHHNAIKRVINFDESMLQWKLKVSKDNTIKPLEVEWNQ